MTTYDLQNRRCVSRVLCDMAGLVFDVLLDDSLAAITSAAQLVGLINKRVLSIINDFEDERWRYLKFQSYLWDNIAQTALSERERAALIDNHHSSLTAAARNLRLTDKSDVGEGSEIAEVFLYGLMRHHFGALPVVPKIFYKQNVQDYAKGADSVHIVVSGGDFTLWFGEAKFYNSIADSRLDAIVESVINSLSSDKLKKENSIITNVQDIDHISMSDELRKKIKASLDSKVSIDYLRPKINVPILILHECQITSGANELSNEYKTEMISYHKERAEHYFLKQMANSSRIIKYKDIKFHIILFPVPDKKKIVDAFVNAVAFYKG